MIQSFIDAMAESAFPSKGFCFRAQAKKFVISKLQCVIYQITFYKPDIAIISIFSHNSVLARGHTFLLEQDPFLFPGTCVTEHTAKQVFLAASIFDPMT